MYNGAEGAYFCSCFCFFSYLTWVTNCLAHFVVNFMQHDANAVSCDAGLNSQLKSAAYAAIKRMTGEDIGDVPVLMSGAGHDAMAMSHLTKVGSLIRLLS